MFDRVLNTPLITMMKFNFGEVPGQKPTTLLNMNFFVGIFQGFDFKFHLANFRVAILKNTYFYQNTSSGCVIICVLRELFYRCN